MSQTIIQIITAFLGVIGFSIMFNIHGNKILVIGIGGAFTWIFYTLMYQFCSDKVISCFVTTVVIAGISEILARVLKTPVILLLVPMLVPLIPGSDLYYMMSYLVLNDAKVGGGYGILLAGEAGAIAFGIIMVTTVTQIIIRSLQYLHKVV